jgi:predicted DNA-binding ribbon-helix-helix protein/CheY-like chemotaxis protein
MKSSVVIGGHKTSISLEEPFWTALKQIAHAQHVTLSALVAQIDDTREQSNLSSAIRVFVLHHFRRLFLRPPETVALRRTSSPRGRAMSSASIAIVDDDEAVREAMKTLVRSLGYNASTFGSAEKFLNSEQIDDTSFLITDLQMPGLSGLDLQDRLIARGYRIPIIFITGFPDDTARARAMKAGALAFLTKPINEHHLIGHLEKALKAA